MSEDFLDLVQRSIDYGLSIGGSASVIFDTAAEHVAVLLSDAVDSFRRGSFGTSIFLAITAMEETAKAEIITFRVRPRPDGSTRGRDPLRHHFTKHQLAIRETTFMGRLPNLLGPEVCARLKQEAGTGCFEKLREKALYVDFNEHGVHTPEATITQERAREIVLLALECADDILVGWTNASWLLRQRFEPWFAEFSIRRL
ncbi:MAG TPA: AbiV family abortive infection protein [Xanthobacteraceae bacterium]|nr:AbiV family abortive infection protein [Xanthobacteraceae bacterium]